MRKQYSVALHFLRALQWGITLLLFSGCAWDGHIYLDETPLSGDTDTSPGSTDTSEDSHTVDTKSTDSQPDVSTADTHGVDTATDSTTISDIDSVPDTQTHRDSDTATAEIAETDSDPVWDTDSGMNWNYLRIFVFFPPNAQNWNIPPDELCVYLIAGTETEIHPFTPYDPNTRRCRSFNSDHMHEFEEMRIPLDVVNEVAEPITVAAILYMNGDHVTDMPQPGEDFWGKTFRPHDFDTVNISLDPIPFR